MTSISPVRAETSLNINDKNNLDENTAARKPHLHRQPDPAGPRGRRHFDIATADGTATVADNDYVANSLTGATIAEGETEYTFYVTINGDTTPEADETFNVTISNVVGATIGDGTGSGPSSTTTPSTCPSTTSPSPRATPGRRRPFHRAALPPALSGGVTFDIATADGTATVANSDYVAIPVTGVTIPEGQTQYAFDVLVNGDATDESTEISR